jgi:hypothetical protein
MKTSMPTILITFALVCFALIPKAQAQEEFANGNTAGGHGALEHLTSGAHNTALGTGALFTLTASDNNTAIGWQALRENDRGINNTATGARALANSTDGSYNSAFGEEALFSNTRGGDNIAVGHRTLFKNTTGDGNTAIGPHAMVNNTAGSSNTAVGSLAAGSNRTGERNTAIGWGALQRNNGDNNIAIGFDSGFNFSSGSNNIDIGNRGVKDESNTIRIGDANQVRTFIAGISGARVTGAIVQINADGQLGMAPSSARFKDEIKPMDKASEALLSLRPVTFRYKKNIDPKGAPQFGLVAEEVEKINSDLIVRDKNGKPYTVRYDAVNAMLLNEFLKEHKKTEKLEATVASLIATVKEQAAQIQKVSTQLEASKSSPQVVNNP